MNTSHLHVDPDSKKEIEAFGLRDHCNVCRKAKGLKPLSETERKVLEQAATTSAGSGSEPIEQLLEDLQAQEAANDELRAQLKEKDAELALLKKELELVKKKAAEK